MTEQNNDNQIELTDLEPNGEVKGGETSTIEGHNIGALLNVAGTNTYTGQTTVRDGATLQIQGGLTVAGEGLGL